MASQLSEDCEQISRHEWATWMAIKTNSQGMSVSDNMREQLSSHEWAKCGQDTQATDSRQMSAYTRYFSPSPTDARLALLKHPAPQVCYANLRRLRSGTFSSKEVRSSDTIHLSRACLYVRSCCSARIARTNWVLAGTPHAAQQALALWTWQEAGPQAGAAGLLA